jgi:hypothetical protein
VCIKQGARTCRLNPCVHCTNILTRIKAPNQCRFACNGPHCATGQQHNIQPAPLPLHLCQLVDVGGAAVGAWAERRRVQRLSRLHCLAAGLKAGVALPADQRTHQRVRAGAQKHAQVALARGKNTKSQSRVYVRGVVVVSIAVLSERGLFTNLCTH